MSVFTGSVLKEVLYCSMTKGFFVLLVGFNEQCVGWTSYMQAIFQTIRDQSVNTEISYPLKSQNPDCMKWEVFYSALSDRLIRIPLQ